jgi:hypothetical protein
MKILNKHFIEIENIAISLNWLSKTSSYIFYIQNNQLHFSTKAYSAFCFKKATEQDILNILHKAQVEQFKIVSMHIQEEEEVEIILNAS